MHSKQKPKHPDMKNKPKKRQRRKAKNHTGVILQTTVHPDAAGIDVGAEEFVACSPTHRPL